MSIFYICNSSINIRVLPIILRERFAYHPRVRHGVGDFMKYTGYFHEFEIQISMQRNLKIEKYRVEKKGVSSQRGGREEREGGRQTERGRRRGRGDGEDIASSSKEVTELVSRD